MNHVRSPGSNNNNTMSLWKWPSWSQQGRKLLRSRQNRQNNKGSTGYIFGLIYVLVVLCTLFVVCRYYYDVVFSSHSNGQQPPPRADNNNDIEMRKNTLLPRKKNKDSQGLSLAVLVAGSTQRFLFDPFVEHVANSSSSSSIGGSGNNHQRLTLAVRIDYFAILTLQAGAAFRQDEYMGHLAGRDKLFAGILGGATTKTDQSLESTQKQMMSIMTDAVAAASSSSSTTTTTSIQALRLLDAPIEDDPVLDAVRERERKRWKKKEETTGDDGFDVFQQFPMMDTRKTVLARTRRGNKNMIRLFLALESLWKTEFLEHEKKRHRPYDYVLILRDDTLWLGDFDLQRVIDTDPTADAYVPSCDGLEQKMLPPEINDHMILIRREKAATVGEYVSALVNTDLRKCHESVSEKWGLGKERGCNSEMILRHVLETNGIRVKLVPQSVLPFERSVLIDGNSVGGGGGDGEDFYCYHKFCQSVLEPLELPPEIQKCKDLEFDKQ